MLASNLQVAVPSTGSYDQAEWIQEDPPPSLLASQDEPFPLLSRIRFTNVVVDKSIPHLVFSDAQALASISGRSLVPTRVAADSFSFAPATGIAQQYLSEALKYDDAAVRYETATRSWGEDSVSTRSSMVANLAARHEREPLPDRRHTVAKIGEALRGAADCRRATCVHVSHWLARFRRSTRRFAARASCVAGPFPSGGPVAGQDRPSSRLISTAGSPPRMHAPRLMACSRPGSFAERGL